MLVFKIVLIGIAGAILVMITKQFKPEYSIPVLLGICLFLIRLQLDIYKTTGYYVDQSVLAADADGNRYTFIIKAAASSMSPDMLSCYTKKINVHESLYLKSAKVLSHYENKGIKYTRIGYLKFK